MWRATTCKTARVLVWLPTIPLSEKLVAALDGTVAASENGEVVGSGSS